MSNYTANEDKEKLNDMKEPLLGKIDSEAPSSVHKDSPFEKFCKKFWVLFAITTGFMFGGNNFLLDITARNHLSAYRMFCLTGPGVIMYWVIYHLTIGIKLYREKGYFWSKMDSYYFKEDGMLDLEVVRLLATRTILGIVSTINVMFVFKTTVASGASSSVITSLFSGTVLATSLAFFLVFHEKVTKKHFLGMLFLILSVILISNSPQDEPSIEVKVGEFEASVEITTHNVSVYVPMLLCFLGCCIFACSTLVARSIKHKRFPQLQYSGDCLIILCIISATLGIIEHNFYEPYTFEQAWGVAFGSFLVMAGALCLNCAAAYGKAGPTQALTQLQSPFQLICELLIYQQAPKTQGLIGMAFGLAGALIIILWKN